MVDQNPGENSEETVQLTGAEFETLWRSLTALNQRICLRIAQGGDVTSLEARKAYAVGADRLEIPAGTVSSALRTLVNDHVLTKAPSGRSRYRLDDVTAEPKLHVFGRFENASFSSLFLSFVFF